MNKSYFESIFAFFDEKPPVLSILNSFWAIFGHFSFLTSINDTLTIELNQHNFYLIEMKNGPLRIVLGTLELV